MWRSLFLAIGVFTLVLGLQCLVLDRVTLINSAEAASLGDGRPRVVVPPEWAPWSLLSAGAVTMIYSFTIPKRSKD